MPKFDWNVIIRSAIGGLVVLIPATVLAQIFVKDSGSSYLAFLFFGVTMFGFATAGYGGGRARSDTPMAHGALSAGAAWIAIQGIGIVSRLSRGLDVSWIGLPLLLLIAMGCGVGGAVFADWNRRQGRVPAA